MKFFRYQHKGKELTIYPAVCWHLGSRQSDSGFIREWIARVKADPNGRWIYLGDGGDCSLKGSKGDVYSATASPGGQLDELVHLLTPIKHKGLFAVSGNHGRRVYKETGLDWDQQFATRIGVPFLGLSTFCRITVDQTVYDVFAHHGLSSGANMGTKINAAKKLNVLVSADAIFSAHSHICCEIPPQHVAYIDGNAHGGTPDIRWRTTYEYVCGCAYDSRSGYAEEKGYTPIIPAHLAVTFSGRRTHSDRPKSQTCTVFRAEA